MSAFADDYDPPEPEYVDVTDLLTDDELDAYFAHDRRRFRTLPGGAR